MMIVMMSTMTSWTTSWKQELINITREDLSLSQNAGNETPESVSHRNDQRGKSLKRKRIEQEDELIKKAINCMEKATTGNSGNVEAHDDCLGGTLLLSSKPSIVSRQKGLPNWRYRLSCMICSMECSHMPITTCRHLQTYSHLLVTLGCRQHLHPSQLWPHQYTWNIRCRQHTESMIVHSIDTDNHSH